MYHSDSLNKRINRLLTFYKGNSLFTNVFPLDNHIIREFYQKCSSRCMSSSIRLKKMMFEFKYTRMEKDSKAADKENKNR